MSLSASYTSTVAEEIVLLLRTLHELEDWNGVINEYTCLHLSHINELAQEDNVQQAPSNVRHCTNNYRLLFLHTFDQTKIFL